MTDGQLALSDPRRVCMTCRKPYDPPLVERYPGVCPTCEPIAARQDRRFGGVRMPWEA